MTMLALILLLLSVYDAVSEGVCHAMAKGDNGCDLDTDQAGDQGRSMTGVKLVSKADMKWSDVDWRQYQRLDITEEDVKDPIKRFSVNIVNSSKLSPNRTIPDNRPSVCSNIKYDLGSLPVSSVIITYRTEPRSTLLRTIVSVLERTPSSLLKEIILVDDNNEDPTVGEELAKIEKVKIVKLHIVIMMISDGEQFQIQMKFLSKEDINEILFPGSSYSKLTERGSYTIKSNSF